MSENAGLNPAREGTVAAVRGSVIDVRFPERLPAVYNQLHAGDAGEIVIEVINHLDATTVRGVALTATQGLARGDTVVDSGRAIEVPVGKELLGRIFNVFGEPIDGGQPMSEVVQRSIHREPVPRTGGIGLVVGIAAGAVGFAVLADAAASAAWTAYLLPALGFFADKMWMAWKDLYSAYPRLRVYTSTSAGDSIGPVVRVSSASFPVRTICETTGRVRIR